MTFEILVSAIVLTYMLGAIAALRVFDMTTELPESERVAARARAGILWPGRFARRVIAFVTGRAAAPAHVGTAARSDVQI